MSASNARIIYQAPSLIDGQPIVVIMTGFSRGSANAKTGNMMQTWIIRSDIDPIRAINTGADASICGSCPLRGIVTLDRVVTSRRRRRTNHGRSCYVAVRQAPRAVYDAFRRGRYSTVLSDRDRLKIVNRFVRFGSYGDPCAVPYWVWRDLSRESLGHTGYTHQWETGRFWRYRSLLMASVETTEQRDDAREKGWRTFRTMSPDTEPETGEFRCPASKEAGQRMDCERCNACDGQTKSGRGVSVAITVHGSPAVLGSYRRRMLAG